MSRKYTTLEFLRIETDKGAYESGLLALQSVFRSIEEKGEKVVSVTSYKRRFSA